MPRHGGDTEDDGWIAHLQHDRTDGTSALVLIDAQDFTGPPPPLSTSRPGCRSAATATGSAPRRSGPPTTPSSHQPPPVLPPHEHAERHTST
ncbi:hypothetical protein ABZT03_30955 [Streptomyces sp. NPDC005574]|uniref:hypothetical protein n=1 Tax=Streptomyces sp. NPDC005574 TaxID=3156891 RepID=UPI0033BF1C79